MYPRMIGLRGVARAGKDTVARMLRDNHAWTIVSFSDPLYDEVSEAFEVPLTILKANETKDEKTLLMSLKRCSDREFVKVATEKIDQEYRAGAGDVLLAPWDEPLSPRWVLQVWGTEYRRAQDPDYWVRKAADALDNRYRNCRGVVNTSVRFPNEYFWLKSVGADIWTVKRKDAKSSAAGHVSEEALRGFPQDIIVHNYGGFEFLEEQVQMLIAARGLDE